MLVIESGGSAGYVSLLEGSNSRQYAWGMGEEI